MVSKKDHIKLADEFFDKSKELVDSDKYVDFALSIQSLLLVFDHLVDAHLSYLGEMTFGRNIRLDRFKSEVLEEDTYILDESIRSFIWNIITRVRVTRDALVYARGDKLPSVETSKNKIKELIEDAELCRNTIKNEVL